MRTTSVGPGDHVADRVLAGLLGSGGEGEVWEATRPDGSRCALKLVRPDVLPDPDEVRRRGRWLVRIDHPAMVRVTRGGRFTTGLLAGWGFVEMDLVEGPSLQDAPPQADALARLAGVAEALDLLHAGRWSDGVPLVHRDVKPGNLLDVGDGLVLVDPSTMRGLDARDLTRVGTPAYLAPEVHRGAFGPLVDVYSLAATAAALRTGLRGSALAPVIAEPWAHGLPEPLCAALDPDPANRPPSCRAALGMAPAPGVRAQGAAASAATIPSAQHRWQDEEPWVDGPAAPDVVGPGWALAALAAVLLVPAVTWSLSRTRPSLVDATTLLGVAGAALAVHLGVHLLAGRPLAGLLAPPWAWGDLLAGDPADRRARWLSDVAAGTLLLGVAGAVAVHVLALAPQLVPAVAAAAVALLATWRRLARGGRLAFAVAWAVGLPLRLLGALPRALLGGR